MNPAQTLIHYIEELGAVAMERAVPPVLAQHAVKATVKALVGTSDDRTARSRARAYFWAVVRRGLVRSAEGRDASARFVLATVVHELSNAGWSSQRVWGEIARGWGDKMPTHLLDEYRNELCA